MVAIVWSKIENRRFESGIDRGVLYPIGSDGVPWDGLVSVEETLSGGEVTPYYFDSVKYLDAVASEDFGATLSALSAPFEFNSAEGVTALAQGLFATQQPRLTFGLSYRTGIASALNLRLGYKLHLVYNVTAAPSSRSYSTKSDKTDPQIRSWELSTVPPSKGDLPIKPTAHFVIDSTLSDPEALALVEAALYGDGIANASLPTPTEINELLS